MNNNDIFIRPRNNLGFATYNCHQSVRNKEHHVCQLALQHKWDFIGLQEIAKSNTGETTWSHHQHHFRLLWNGSSHQQQSSGVGLLLSAAASTCLTAWETFNPPTLPGRFLIAHFNGTQRLHCIVTYAPHTSHSIALQRCHLGPLSGGSTVIPQHPPSPFT